MKLLSSHAAVALAITLLLGVLMRWLLTGQLFFDLIDFSYIRHAHSHLGYFGILFPLTWIAWHRNGVPYPHKYVIFAYIIFNLIAFIGFLSGGYGPIAIIGCTGVAIGWIISSIPLIKRSKNLHDPIAGAFWSILVALACIPPIAIFLRRDPPLAQGFISTFLSSILFLIIIPAALSIKPNLKLPWPSTLLFGISASLALGVLDNPITRLGTIIYSFLLAFSALYSSHNNTENNNSYSPKFPLDLQCAWLSVSIGIAGLALNLIPNVRSVAIGAIHFLILGPVLGSLVLQPKEKFIRPLWFLGQTFWGGMSAALVAQAFGATFWTWYAAAIFGTLSAIWWIIYIIYRLIILNPIQKTTT